MWKRENETSPSSPAAPSPAAPAMTPTAAPRREPEPAMPRVSEPTSSGGRAVIGAGTVIRGEVSGEEDLMVEGKIEGKIELRQNSVTVGAKGRISAEVHARILMIDGEVDGNLTAEEQIVIRRSGRVRGDLVAPRVTIEDGARFKGSIDMEPKRAAVATPALTPRPTAAPKNDPISASLAAAVGGGNS